MCGAQRKMVVLWGSTLELITSGFSTEGFSCSDRLATLLDVVLVEY